ncbi:MAG TPA: sarcosine oxidase subunit gamma family protein [Alphaproteobacteria bacterium]|nr:sarcosine oxidase subunit gamma family protein [Alphaproteobacteria bacterium]
MYERSALASARAGAPARWSSERLTIEERPRQGAIALRLGGESERRLGSKLLELDMDAQVGTAIERSDRAVLRLGPDEWLLLCKRDEEGRLASELRQALADQTSSAAPLGNGTVALEIAGPQLRAFLAHGTSLDLHPRAFGPGRCAATGFGKIRVLLWQRDAERLLLLVGRSFARSFWDWAIDVARQWSR